MQRITHQRAAINAIRPIVKTKSSRKALTTFLAHASHKPRFLMQGNYIVAIVRGLRNEFVGVAKRNPEDKFDITLGENIAHVRALRQLGRHWQQLHG